MMKRTSPKRAMGDPYELAVRFLAARPKSVAEIRRHLRSKGHAEDVIDQTVDRLRAQRYVDDADFARYWVEQRERFRPKGSRAVVSELMQKGVSRETIDLVLGERPPDSQVRLARAAIRRPLARWLTLEPADRKRKIHAFLTQRGFDYETIEQVLAHPDDEDDQEAGS
ncbi:MAG: regulatory protein RecX [Chloroflexi bacterium]|nr:regulatory protein RecX [Chloroflexota bacterium]